MLRTLSHYAWRELLNHRRFALFFVLNLSLGLMGFVILLLTRDAVDNHFSSKLREILGADWVVSTRLPPSPDDAAWIVQTFTESLARHAPELTLTTLPTNEMLTMIHGAKQSRLMRVVGVDEGFPLYGTLNLREHADTTAPVMNGRPMIAKGLLAQRQIWLDAATATGLAARLGDTLTLGDTPLTLGALVVDHPSRSLGFTSLLPTVYVARQVLDESGLITVGSRVLWKWSFQMLQQSAEGQRVPLTESPRFSALLKNLQDDFAAAQAARHQTAPAESAEDRYTLVLPADSGERMQMLTERITGFMNLISLIGLFFSGLGLGYLFRYYAQQRLHDTAIARALGMTHWQAQTLLLLQLMFLSLIALGVAVLAGLLWSHLGLAWVSQWLGQSLQASFRGSTLLWLASIALTTSWVFTLPVMVRHRHIKPALILRLLPGESPPAEAQPSSLRERWLRWASLIPVLLFLWLASVLLVELKLGSWFFLLLMLVFLGLLALGLAVMALAQRFSHRFGIATRLAIRALTARRTSTLSGLLAIALGVFLMALLPQMAATLREEVRAPAKATLPAFFLFDIQDAQLEPLQDWLNTQIADYPQLKLGSRSPQVRGRITHINDVPVNSEAVQERIDKQQQQFIRQGVNLTFRAALSATESLAAGRALQSPSPDAAPDDPVEVSLESRFSTRLGVKLGDTLTFLIHGLPLKALITNLRDVHWNSFQPNFFIQFPPGVLEDAPKTWVANLAGIPINERQVFQGKLSSQFSNISAIDVGALVEELLSLANQMLLAIYGLALIALVAGVTVMVSVALSEVDSAEYEFGLIKVLGGGRRHLLHRAMAQFTVPCALAALMGFAVATLLANVLAQTFLQSPARYPLADMAWLLGFVLTLLYIIFWGMAQRMLRVKSGLLLNAD